MLQSCLVIGSLCITATTHGCDDFQKYVQPSEQGLTLVVFSLAYPGVSVSGGYAMLTCTPVGRSCMAPHK